MATVRYIRNRRPNQVTLKLYPRTQNQIVFKLERRGTMADSLAVPAEAFTDNGFLRNIQKGTIEEISEAIFMGLGTRLEDKPQGELVERTPHGVASAFDPDVKGLKMGVWNEDPESGERFYEPFTIEKFNQELMKPRLEFAVITDSEEDADEALIAAGQKPGKPKARKSKTTTEEKAEKFDTVTRANTPRRGVVKGVVGGSTLGNEIE